MTKEYPKKIWDAGKVSVNGWISIGNAFSSEIMAAQDYDSICIDLQHGALHYSEALSILQAVAPSGIFPFARVPSLDSGLIGKLLDSGARGIICPMIDTAEDAAEFVSCLRYPPHGKRSYGPIRAKFFPEDSYTSVANESILAFAMLETERAVANMGSIISTPGLDGIYVGPADLSISLYGGRLAPGIDREEDDLIAVFQSIAEACGSAGKYSGIHCASSAYAARAASWGFNMVTLSSDLRLLSGAAADSIARLRQSMA